MLHNELFLKELSNLIKQKSEILWPSAKTTPMTESNLKLAISEIYRDKKYHTYMEIPFVSNHANMTTRGLYDLITISDDFSEMNLVETKSDKKTWDSEMVSDFTRLLEYKHSNLTSFNHSREIQKINIYSIIWTEDLTKKTLFDRLHLGERTGSEFDKLDKNILWVKTCEITYDKSYNQPYYILVIGQEM